MAYQTGTSTTIEDLMQQLSTFLVANGWTEDFATTGDPGLIAFSKNTIFVAFQYTEATDGGTLAIYQNLSNDDSTNVWLSTGDSGVGNATAAANAFDNGRSLAIIAGPHTAYHFFEQDANPAYIHVVLEVDAGRYRHMGWGELEKIGDWVGGEYCYGQFVNQNATVIDNPNSGSNQTGLDGTAQLGQNFSPTMHVRDQPEQAAADRWSVIGTSGNFPAGQDRAGNDRLHSIGSTRGGMTSSVMSQFRMSQLTAFKPLIPIPIVVADNTGTPNTARLLGTQPDVRVINMASLEPGETFTVAGETWFAFPWVKKQFLKNDTEESWNAGFAYRQELA